MAEAPAVSKVGQDGSQTGTGRIVQIVGPVVDVEFPEGQIPDIYTALDIDGGDGNRIVLEVEQALGNNWVRAVSMSPTEGLSRGMAVRREVLGDTHVDRATDGNPFTADFQDFLTRYAWGEIWDRPGLDRRMRSVITLTALATLNHDNELAMHIRAALRNGLTRDEIKEVLLQVSIYAGVPAANRAFAVARDTLAKVAAEEAG